MDTETKSPAHELSEAEKERIRLEERERLKVQREVRREQKSGAGQVFVGCFLAFMGFLVPLLLHLWVEIVNLWV